MAGDTLRLPKNEDAVCIGETGGSRGLGVFALEDIPLRRRVIHEYYALGCKLGGPAGLRKKRFYRRDIVSMWEGLSDKEKERLQQRFWKLRFIPSKGKPGLYSRSRLRNFLREYGFYKAGGEKKVLVYRVASRINHACRSCANAEWVVDSSDCSISIRVTRHMMAGEEILIHYGRSKGNLACCMCDSLKAKEKLGSTWDRFLRWSSRLIWKGEEEQIRKIKRQAGPGSDDEMQVRLLAAQEREGREKGGEADRRSSENQSLLDGRHKPLRWAKRAFKRKMEVVVNVEAVHPIQTVEAEVKN